MNNKIFLQGEMVSEEHYRAHKAGYSNPWALNPEIELELRLVYEEAQIQARNDNLMEGTF